jgi:hypothetical protein
MADASSSERNARATATPPTMALMHATMLAAVNNLCSGPVATTPMRSNSVIPHGSVGEERHRRRVQAKEELADPEGPTA